MTLRTASQWAAPRRCSVGEPGRHTETQILPLELISGGSPVFLRKQPRRAYQGAVSRPESPQSHGSSSSPSQASAGVRAQSGSKKP